MRRVVWVLPLLFLFGCGSRPPEISNAEIQSDRAIQTFVDNTDQQQAFLLEKLRESEYGRVDTAYKNKLAEIDASIESAMKRLAGADGNITLTPGQVKSINEQLNAKRLLALQSREALRRDVDDVIATLYDAMDKNKLNLAVALKINAAIKRYDDAGIDMSAAQEGIDAIFALLKKYNIGGAKKRRGRTIQPTEGAIDE